MRKTKQVGFDTFIKLSYCPILGIRYLGLTINNQIPHIIEHIDYKNTKIQKMKIVNNHFSRQKR